MPNNIPLNWCECKLEDLCEVISKGSTPKNQTEKPNWAKILKAENITKESIIDSTSCKYIDKETHTTTLKRSILKKNDILITIAGTLGRCAVVETEENLNTNQAVCFVRLLNCGISPHFIKYYALSPVVNNGLTGKAKITAIPNLTLEVIKNIDVVLPPLAEQERIVEKIEALFAGIDEGVERLKSAQAQIKQYRQSVLKSAFEGKLYKTTDWKEVQLKDVCEKITDGSHFSPKQVSNGCYPYITVKDVRKDIIDFDAAKRIDKKQYELLLKSGCKPYKGDVLFSKDGTVGKVVLVDYEKEFVILSSLAILRPKKELKSEFLFYVLKSPKFLAEAINKKTGVAIRRIILDTLKRISISFPSDISEQQRIVEEIEKRFAVADELEKAVNEGLEKADKLKQSILKKAFEGKLVPQDPNDEPASVLLDRIKASKQPQSKGKKK